MINKEELLKRFLQYVQIDTGACESPLNAPSSAGQLQLGKLLADQLLQFGLSEVCQTEQGIVYATIPATVTSSEPVICFCAHLDTSPDVPTGPVVPQIISSYNGEDIVFSGDSSKVLSPRDNQDLAAQKGNTIITSDGTTLLGADDKTGVAIIMELARILTSNPQIPHGEIRLCFTCDEELGRGVDHVDLNKIKADFAYTLDSSGVYGIDVETFSADMVTMVIHGRNIHPSIAKGKMINAIKIASRVIADLPSKRLSPETTDSRDGFIHPVELNASVETAIIKFILRSFNTHDLECYLLFLNSIENYKTKGTAKARKAA